MVGYGENKGIIPRVTDEIFARIHAREQDPNNKIQHEVKLQMLQIYNEKVQDLLVKKTNKPKEDLAIREGKNGVYVEGANEVPVSSYDEINAQIELGTSNRAIGATNMNATSSRAHTVSAIKFIQKFFGEDGTPLNKRESSINLIDLAGSERAGSTGATGDRLAEGAKINQSLSVLGKVIGALATSAGNKKVVIPYRESKLTYLLKPFLGGNSKTAMIAALSPASINYDETLSTLRYAN